jgi:hypothetical protein
VEYDSCTRICQLNQVRACLALVHHEPQNVRNFGIDSEASKREPVKNACVKVGAVADLAAQEEGIRSSVIDEPAYVNCSRV